MKRGICGENALKQAQKQIWEMSIKEPGSSTVKNFAINLCGQTGLMNWTLK